MFRHLAAARALPLCALAADRGGSGRVVDTRPVGLGNLLGLIARRVRGLRPSG